MRRSNLAREAKKDTKSTGGGPDWGCVTIIVLVILFWGEPDLIDATISLLNNAALWLLMDCAKCY